MNMASQVAIAIGSNLNDPPAQIALAIAALEAQAQIQVLKVSQLYWSEPQYPAASLDIPAAQPPYLNGAALLETDLSPRQLMTVLLEIEAQQGRIRVSRWQARPLDLDVILWQDTIINDPLITVPHPRCWERAFVILPLAEIVPSWQHPIFNVAIATRAQQLAAESSLRPLDAVSARPYP